MSSATQNSKHPYLLTKYQHLLPKLAVIFKELYPKWHVRMGNCRKWHFYVTLGSMTFHLDPVSHVNLAHFFYSKFSYACTRQLKSSYSVNSLSGRKSLQKINGWFFSPFNSGSQGETFKSSFWWSEISCHYLE